jgi:hypothetical protein
MERDALIERRDLGGSPPHVEYVLTERGRLLTPLLDALRAAGQALDCNSCEDRHARHGSYCESCPHVERPAAAPAPRRSASDDSIVLL